MSQRWTLRYSSMNQKTAVPFSAKCVIFQTFNTALAKPKQRRRLGDSTSKAILNLHEKFRWVNLKLNSTTRKSILSAPKAPPTITTNTVPSPNRVSWDRGLLELILSRDVEAISPKSLIDWAPALPRRNCSRPTGKLHPIPQGTSRLPSNRPRRATAYMGSRRQSALRTYRRRQNSLGL